MPVRSLSPELQKIAKKELDEDPQRISEDLTHIKEWLAKQPHLNARTDDQWLLAFLRGCKFSLERTKEKLDTFYTMRSILPEFFTDRDPFSPKMQEVLLSGAMIPLPHPDNPSAPTLIIVRNGCTDPDRINIADIFKLNLMLMDIALNEDDKGTIVGTHVVQDFKQMTSAHFLQMTPAVTKKFLACVQDAYPVRTKGIHFLQPPTIFESVYSILKPFFSNKMKSRMKMYNKNNLDELYKTIPLELLPNEYGGNAGQIDDLIKFWKAKVESYRDWFLDDEQYGTDESKRPGQPKTAGEVFGVEGSFRKLNVD